MKRCFKQLLTLVCVLALFSSLTCSLAALTFTDVPNSYWAHDEIEFIVNKGLFNGTTATTFSPDAQMKRGQLAAVLYRYAGSPKVSSTAAGYSDVASGTYYYDAIRWAKANSIFMADKLSASSLKPDEGITRSEFAVMLYNFAKLNGKAEVKSNASNPYTDMKNVSTEIKTAMVNWAVPAGVLNGTSGTTMSPFAAIKRSHVAAMLYRYETKIANPGSGEEEKPTETKPTTPSDTTKTSYSAGDTLVLKKGGTYTVNIGIGEKVYINDQLSSVEGWTAYDGNKFVDGKRVAEISWDSSKNMMALNGLAASDVTIQCLSMNDYTTVLAKINVTVSSTSTGGNGNTSSGTSDDYMDIREEIVRLTNEVRKENGVAELPTDDALMRAAQAAAEEYLRTGAYNAHDMKMESEKLRAEGINYGFNSNLTAFTNRVSSEGEVASYAVNNWVNSSGHFRTMTDSGLDNIGIGVVKDGNTWLCFQFFTDVDSTMGIYS